MDGQTTAPTTTTTEPASSQQPPQPLSIAEHEKQFGEPKDVPPSSASSQSAASGTTAETTAPTTTEPAAETAATEPAETDEEQAARERGDDGKFKKGSKATQDVARIKTLTGRAKTAEEKVQELQAENSRLRAMATARAPMPQGTADPEPLEKDYGNDMGRYFDDRAKWLARQEYRRLRGEDAKAVSQADQAEASRQHLAGWAARVETARAKYKDFDTVIAQPSPWLDRAGRAIPGFENIDKWVMEHSAGLDVLHYLHTNKPERDALMALPALGQIEYLALLSQKFASAGRTPGATGSGKAAFVDQLPPPPPNPVRTEAQRAGDAPPAADGSLSIADHEKVWGPKARNR